MSRVTELEKALTTLFRKGTEVGYTETEIDEFLENIDYHALLQAVWNKAETVYAYRADGKNALSLDYRSAELFKQRATLLYEDVGDSYIGAVFAARSMELWLLEDIPPASCNSALKRSPPCTSKRSWTVSARTPPAFGIRKPISWRCCSIPFPPSTTTTPCWSITIFTVAPKGRHFSCPIPGERI